MSVFACFAVQLRGLRQILLDAEPGFVGSRVCEAPFDLFAVACLLEKSCRGGVVPRETFTGRVQAAESEAAERDLLAARSLKETGGSGEILSNALAGSVQGAKMGASVHVATIAGLLKERGTARDILREASASPVENAKARAAIHGAALAPLAEEVQGANGIPLDAAAALVHGAQARASLPDAAVACALEQRGSVFVVLEYVLSLLKLDGELITGRGFARLARAAQLFGFGVPGVTSGERDGDE
jgi:hypothetical protein